MMADIGGHDGINIDNIIINAASSVWSSFFLPVESLPFIPISSYNAIIPSHPMIPSHPSIHCSTTRSMRCDIRIQLRCRDSVGTDDGCTCT